MEANDRNGSVKEIRLHHSNLHIREQNVKFESKLLACIQFVSTFATQTMKRQPKRFFQPGQNCGVRQRKARCRRCPL